MPTFSFTKGEVTVIAFAVQEHFNKDPTGIASATLSTIYKKITGFALKTPKSSKTKKGSKK